MSSLITMGVVGLLVFLTVGIKSGYGSTESKKSGLENAVRIEAALAFKKPDKKKRQPQKRKKKKFKPNTVKVSRDEEAKPKDEEKKPRVEPDEIDPLAVLSKNRKLMEDDNSDTGSEADPDEGAIFGDEWGSGDKNKGDPYVGGLKARVQRTFRKEAPGFIEAGKTVWGCLRLDKDGKVEEAEVPEEGRSDVAALNSAMQETLKKVPEMDKPVPKHLIKLLTEMGVCFRFKTK